MFEDLWLLIFLVPVLLMYYGVWCVWGMQGLVIAAIISCLARD